MEPTRLQVTWSAKWKILVTAVLAAIAVGVFTYYQPVSYDATATLRVSIPQTRNAPRETPLGANELAAQYSQLATSQPVLEEAQRTMSAAAASGLGSNVSASPLNSFNVIGVTATGPDAKIAADRADSVANALAKYLADSNAAQVADVSKAVDQQLAGLDDQIKSLQARIAKTPASDPNYQSQQSLLGSLVNQRAAAAANTTGDAILASPTISVLDLPAAGQEQKPKTFLYAGVAFLVGLIGAIELVLLSSQLKASNRLPRHARDADNIDISNSALDLESPRPIGPGEASGGDSKSKDTRSTPATNGA